jgi:KaiC/GvpD/RAD55 family RecA-like ATPase
MTDNPNPGGADDPLLCLMLSLPERIQQMNISALRSMLQKDCVPLVVTVNQPYRVLMKKYAKEGLDPKKIYVIDAVTQYSGGTCDLGENVRYVTNPANLTDLGIAITEMLKHMPDQRRCIIFDSVSMLLIHIPSVTASKFLHFVMNKLRLSNVDGIFLCVEKGLDPMVLSQLSSFVDRIVEFDSPEQGAGLTAITS